MSDLLDLYKQAQIDKGTDWQQTFRRLKSMPIDSSSVFFSKDDADKYADGTGDVRGLTSTAFGGQIIAVSIEDEKFPWRAYIVDTGAGKLIPILIEQDKESLDDADIKEVIYNNDDHKIQLVCKGNSSVKNTGAVVPVVTDATFENGLLTLSIASDENNPAEDIQVPLNGLVTNITGSASDGQITFTLTKNGETEEKTITIGNASGEGSAPSIEISDSGTWVINGIDTGEKAIGEDGYTPQKRTDYFTDEDIAEVASEAVDLIPKTTTVVEDDSVLPTSGAVKRSEDEQYQKVIDRVGPLGASRNCLDFYDPSLIDVEYVNTLPGWEVKLSGSGVNIESGRYISRRDPATCRIFSPYEVIFSTPDTYVSGSACTVSLCTTEQLKGQKLWIKSASITEEGGPPLFTSDEEINTDPSMVIYSSAFDSDDDAFSGSNGPVGIESGYMVFDATTADWANVFKHFNDIKPGGRYKVNFRARCDKDDASMSFNISDNWNQLLLEENIKIEVSTSWSEYQIEFDTSALTSTAVLIFSSSYFASEAPVFNIDDFSITEVMDCSFDGFVRNGDFESNSVVGWTTYKDTSVSSDETHSGDCSLLLQGPSLNWPGLASQTISQLEVGKQYLLSFWYKAKQQGVNFKLSNGGADLATPYLSNKEWTRYTSIFKATSDTATLSFNGSGLESGKAGYEEGTDIVYVDDVSISLLTFDDVSDPSLWERSDDCVVVTEPTMALEVPCGERSWVTKLKYKGNLPLEPSKQYKLTFNIISFIDPNKLDWLPYTTFSDRDKISLVTEGVVPAENLQCGGPWVGNPIDSTHMLRIRVHGDTNNPLYLNSISLLAKNISADEGYINIEPAVSLNSQPVDIVDKVMLNSWGRDGTVIRPMLTAPIDLVSSTTELSDRWNGNAVDMIEFVIHPVPQLTDGKSSTPQICKLFGYGYRKNNSYNYLPYEIGPEKEFKVTSRLTAESIDSLIDDGCLDIY